MTRDEQRDSTLLEQAFSAGEMRRAEGGCPSEGELWASAAGELDPAANEEVVLHLARCGECSTIWRLAREMLPVDHLSQGPVVSIERGRRSKVWRRLLLPAAAAAILVGVGLSTGLFQRSVPAPEPVFREPDGGFEIHASAATASLPRSECRLRWSAGPAGTRYDLIVTDGALEIIEAVDRLGQPEYQVPEEKIPGSATELLWRVTAHLPDGSTVSSDTFSSLIEGASPSAGP